jgi:hypothetical protein
MIIHVILERNPELIFNELSPVDLDKVWTFSLSCKTDFFFSNYSLIVLNNILSIVLFIAN